MPATTLASTSPKEARLTRTKCRDHSTASSRDWQTDRPKRPVPLKANSPTTPKSSERRRSHRSHPLWVRPGAHAVKVYGADFTGVKSVAFGGMSAASFTVESDASLTAISPAVPAAGVVDVSVTTNAGSSKLAGSSFFEYIAPPVSAALPNCAVPNLKGKTLKAARRRARRADCKLDKVRRRKGATAKNAKVIKQSPKPGEVLAPGGKVNVKLGG